MATTSRFYANNVSTTLSAAITTTGQTSITVTSATGLPAISTNQSFNMTLNDGSNVEIVQVTAVSGTTLTIVRTAEAVNGASTPHTFANGTPISLNATAASLTTTAAPSANGLVSWDGNSNLTANNMMDSYTTTVSSVSLITLTVASTYQQYITGSTAQLIKLPVTSTLVLGQQFQIFNSSTAATTIESSGANSIIVMPPNSQCVVTCILASGTTAASWAYNVSPIIYTGLQTWTPAITFATPGNVSVAYGYQVGTYSQIGNIVIANFNIQATATMTTASGALLITGLGFAQNASQASNAVGTYTGNASGASIPFPTSCTSMQSFMSYNTNVGKIMIVGLGASATNGTIVSTTQMVSATQYAYQGTIMISI